MHYTGVDPQTGQYTFQDKNHDGMLVSDQSAADDLLTYDLNPKYAGGFGIDFDFNKWTVNAYFVFKRQIGYNAYNSSYSGGQIYNQPVQVLDRWILPGENSQFARYTTRPNTSDRNLTQSDAILTDASYVRLTNLSLSYSLQKSSVGNLQIFIKGQNLILISNYKGIDPERQAFGSLPYSRIITAGLKYSL